MEFRAKSLETNDWLYGSLLFQGGNAYIYTSIDGKEDFHEVDKETVCQFTGLKSVEKKKIYEYDEVEFLGNKFTVIYFDGYYALTKDGSNIEIVNGQLNCICHVHNGLRLKWVGTIFDK